MLSLRLPHPVSQLYGLKLLLFAKVNKLNEQHYRDLSLLWFIYLRSTR